MTDTFSLPGIGPKNLRFLRTDHLQEDLAGKSVRSGAIVAASQIVRLVVGLGSTAVLARLLSPADYGLVGMVTVLLAFLEIFKDAGLSTATVQRKEISQAQVSNLFWINSALGAALMCLVIALSPLVVAFYREPRLLMVSIALSGTFLVSGMAVQHQALLRRQMRFKTLAVIELTSLVVGIAVAVVMAIMAFQYWAIVGMTLASVTVSTFATWICLPWLPSRPVRQSGVRPMLGFGGHILGNNFLNAFVRNAPQILIGWYAGAASLGLYNKAYQLLMLPLGQINGPVGQVIVPALSRMQGDTEGIRRFYLGAYRLVVSLTLPIMGIGFVYAEELVVLVLGGQWREAGPIFRYLCFAGLFIAVMSPTGWFLIPTQRTARYFKLGLVETPIVLIACFIGVRYGAEGLALGFAIARAAECLPMMYLIYRHTEVSLKDVWEAARNPFLALGIAGAAGFLLKGAFATSIGKPLLTFLGCATMVAVYGLVLLVILRQWPALRGMLALIFGSRLNFLKKSDSAH